MKLQEVYSRFTSQASFEKAVNRELIKIATENPDFIYNNTDTDATCYYNRGVNGSKGKGCIFGQALQKLGWSYEEELEKKYSIRSLLTDFTEINSSSIPSYWPIVQRKQDCGETWKAAVEAIPKEIREQLNE